MPRTAEIQPARPRPSVAPPERPRPNATDEALSADAVRAIEEGRADHAAGRSFTLSEIKRELGIEP